MPTVAAFLPRALLLSRPRLLPPPPPLVAHDVGGRWRCLHQQQLPFPIPARFSPSKHRLLVRVQSHSGSSSSSDELDSKGRSYRRSSSKEPILLNLIQEIEPLDVSLIQKDVPPNTIDAMKRTISGMLGLLPSDQFNVMVEAFWVPLLKLLVSSMKTGYTLRNAEYRLCLERSLDINREDAENEKKENAKNISGEVFVDEAKQNFESPMTDSSYCNREKKEDEVICDYAIVEGLDGVTPEAQQYILNLQSRLDSLEKELHDIKRENSALEMQQFVGEEKNDLLDYLRSLQPEKVAELSEPTCPGVEETIQSVVHGLLATLSPRMQSKPPPQSETTGGTKGVGNDDYAELVENTSIQFQPLISISRDYLARLLFWCMLLGHYIRGLEYRLELMQLLTISGEPEILYDGDWIA